MGNDDIVNFDAEAHTSCATACSLFALFATCFLRLSLVFTYFWSQKFTVSPNMSSALERILSNVGEILAQYCQSQLELDAHATMSAASMASKAMRGIFLEHATKTAYIQQPKAFGSTAAERWRLDTAVDVWMVNSETCQLKSEIHQLSGETVQRDRAVHANRKKFKYKALH
ncbi:hypothetical protein C8J56DRAFT_897606 [Mycena floridula]|nr:hypothetical protein C8J56DRAFT_897606 [Mycena floridula]